VLTRREPPRARRTPRARPPRARARADVVAFLGPSLPAAVARDLAGVRILPPARAGDVLAALPARPLAIALVDGLFDTTPSVWHREILAALEAGVAVFGGASLGALRAAELSGYGVIGVGRVFEWYRDGLVDDDGEVALLHGDAEHGFRPLTVPLVQVRAAAEAARAAGALRDPEAAALVRAAAGIHYTERSWASVLAAVRLPAARRRTLGALLPRQPDVKAADAAACLAAAVAFARARRRGAPAVPPPLLPPASAHLRRLRLARVPALLPGGAEVPGAALLARLRRRPDAGRLAADGLRRLLLARWARALGFTIGDEGVAAAERAWLGRLGAGAGGRAAALAALGLDDGAARALAEDLALEARLLSAATAAVPDGPAWEEGLALGARLSGAWLEEAAGWRAPRRTRSGR
jgi:hypothetical protein